MKTEDKLTPELRKIETEIDNYYKSNPLVNLPFATSAWYLLVAAEKDALEQEFAGIDEINNIHILASEFSVNLEPSMSWLYSDCNRGGQVTSVFDDNLYKASRDLFELGKKYACFDFTYRCAGRGVFTLEPQGSTIQPIGDLFQGLEYEAYNILIDFHHAEEPLSSTNFEYFPIDAIQRSLRIEGDRFRYKLNPRMVSDTVKYLKPFFDRMFSLPSEWQFSRYSLGEFRKVFEIICAISHIHFSARGLAVTQACHNFGYANSIYMPTCDELLRRVVNYSRVSESAVQNIFDDLTYGYGGILHPTPALQPLIKLNSDIYAIVPHLWISSAAEVNFTMLLNKLPSEKHIYSKLASEKEGLMRKRITAQLDGKGFRIVSGDVPDLPDIDLAIITDSEKTCLLLELKWFIAPALARERIEKSEEIAKGVSQVIRLKQAFANNHLPLLNKLKIDSSYRLEGVVVSENWIGYADVQSPEVPVIQSDHLIAKLRTAQNLESAVEWLKARKYLPREGEHFKVDRELVTIGDWTLNAPTVDLLTNEPFFPL